MPKLRLIVMYGYVFHGDALYAQGICRMFTKVTATWQLFAIVTKTKLVF
jgi:hypothetical protein